MMMGKMGSYIVKLYIYIYTRTQIGNVIELNYLG